MNGASLSGPWLAQLAAFSPLVVMLAKVTLLLAAVWIGQLMLLGANPRWRVLAWRGAAVALLMIPLLHVVTPPIEFHDSNPTASVDAATGARVAASDGDFAHRETPTPATPTTTANLSRHEPDLWHAAASEHPSWRFVGLSVWCGGCLFFFCRMAVGLRRLHSLVRRSESAPAYIRSGLARVADDLTVTTHLEVRVSAHIPAPILCGLYRRTLLIPARMTSASRAEQLPGVFAHELAHVQSHDLIWNLLLHTISTALWFHPLAWFARAAHAAACESVSDAVAVGYLGDVQAYGRTLARVALDAVAPPALSLTMARSSNVQKRVRALERRVFALGLCRPLSVTVVAVGLLMAVALGGFKAVRADLAGQPRPTVGSQETQGIDGPLRDKSDNDTDGAVTEVAVTDNPAALITPETEAAVSKALAFLVSRQREDGSFGSEKLSQRDPAMTALCGMALLAAGSKPGAGPYGTQVEKALDYLLDRVHENGFIGVQKNVGSMYVHAYAMRFLAEAQLVHKMPRTEQAMAKAVELIVKSQNASDGWRYMPNSQDADSSVTSCQVIALQAARRAGAQVPQETIDRAINYLNRCQTPDGGYAYVHGAHQSALPRSASVVAAFQLSNLEGKEIEKNLEYLNANATPPDNKAAHYFFTQFHLSTALRHAGEAHFRRWYEPSRDQLLKMQAGDGSWPIQHDVPEYGTAKACVVLLSPRKPIARPE